MISIQRPGDQSTGAVSRPELARQPAFPENQLKPATISAFTRWVSDIREEQYCKVGCWTKLLERIERFKVPPFQCPPLSAAHGAARSDS